MKDLTLEGLLKKTIPDINLFDKYWDKNQFCMKKLCDINDYTSLNCFEDLFVDFFNRYPASSIYKERVIRPFLVKWYQSTAQYMEKNDKSEDLFAHYIVKDKTIELLKALHPREGATKADIADKIGVSGENMKTVQTDLRLLSPSLGNNSASYKGKHLTVGGHVVNVEITEKRDLKGNKRFLTPNTVNPLVLLPNVMQVGVLLKSLSRLYYNEKSDVAMTIGLNIWLQLSDYCKERIKKIFTIEDKALNVFLEELDCCACNNETTGFITEREMYEDSIGFQDITEKLMLAFKANRTCDIILYKDGVRQPPYNKQKITILKNNYYRATSVENPNISVDFSIADIYDINLTSD